MDRVAARLPQWRRGREEDNARLAGVRRALLGLLDLAERWGWGVAQTEIG
jgi:hypothetical protein